MKQLIFIITFCMLPVVLSAQNNQLSDFPAGSTPQEIGNLMGKRFIQLNKHTLYRGTCINYMEVCNWLGALRYAERVGNRELIRQLQDRFAPLFAVEKAIVPEPLNVDLAVFGALPLELYKITGDKRYFDMGLAYADAQWTLPTNATEAQKTWADKGFSWHTRLWIDDMYMITILQAQAYKITGDRKYIDRAAKEMVVYLDSLQKSNGLFYHAPDVPFFWGRGNGWMAAGMTELLNALPADNPDRPRIMKAYLTMMENLKRYQSPSGIWNQLVDAPDCWAETSGSAMFAFALISGVKAGWLEASVYGDAARQAWLMLVSCINPDGDITDVCVGTNKKNDRQYYYDRPRATGDYHGQAAMLWCAYALLSDTRKEQSVWDVYDYGAQGDGEIVDTKAIQAAIDDCHYAGGGTVCLHNGRFLSGTIYLKSQVSLRIENGATLLGSRFPQDYPVIESKYPSYHGRYITNRMLIYAEDAENISIEGDGIINGRGDEFENINRLDPLTERPKIIHLRGCKQVKIQDLTLRNSASWVQSYLMCADLLINGITVDSRENKDIEKARYADVPGRNTDGLDIVDCRNVRIANCYINSGDDGICLKSFSRNEVCRNITITNCVITTNASGIKMGTESVGGFQDISISNCSIYDTRLGGIDVMCVDGAKIERVIVSNITLRNIKGTAIFVRLGNRGRLHRENEETGIGSVKDISFQNIYGSGIGRYGCSITGIPGAPVENVTLNNINLIFEGGNQPLLFEGTAGKPVTELTADNVPEFEEKHPRGDMFGKLPAYGFYVRHVRNIRFDGVRLNTAKEDSRPAVIFDDVKDVTTNGLITGTSAVPVNEKDSPIKENVKSYSRDIQLLNVYNRRPVSLDGQWQIIIDPMETGYYDYRYKPKPNGFFQNEKVKDKTELVEYHFDSGDHLNVPGDWNSQKQELLWYEGTIWYKKDFTFRKNPDKRVFLYFGAVNYEAKVYLNGQKLGEHTGGFTPFSFEVTDVVHDGENFVVLKVDNTRRIEAIPTINSDWWNYGGITRSVNLVEAPKTFICDYFIQLAKGKSQQIEGYVRLSGASAQQKVRINIPELKFAQTFTTDASGYAKISFTQKPILWSPENPKLYDVSITAGDDSIIDRIGFRTIETKGQDILLNGQPIFLRGVCIHEEAAYRGGRAHSAEDARILLTWAKDMGCNFVRLTHYPHSEQMIREAERMGILVWSEIPLYWTIQWENPDVLVNAKNQFFEMFNRDKNRAAVILWSLANETPLGDARLTFLKSLSQYIRSLDSTRLLTAALETHSEKDNPNTIIINDPLGEYLDVLGCNEYYGWYNGLPDKSPTLSWETTYDKPLIMSEFGAGALYGKHGDKLDRWTEEYQEYFFAENLKMLKKVPFLRGTTPWVLMDFRSPKRPLSGIQDYYNRKGLISDQGNKKKAFYTMRNFYQEITPDNTSIEADGHSKLYVPVKKITAQPGYHWFAYYDKIQVDPSNRYVLAMQTTFEHRSPTPEDVIEIGMIDLHNRCEWIKLGESHAWGWQQGCQLQFIPGSKNEIVWNDKEGERFVCHIMNIETRQKRTIPWSIYALSPDGKWAVTTDYRRVNDTRPGYGYAGIPDPYKDQLAPDSSGIWKIDMRTGEAQLLISIAQVAGIKNPYDTETADAKHWFNHLLVNPDGTRFIFLHRWRYPDAERTSKYADVGGWGTRMLTAAADGSDIRIIDPYNYTSHFIWRDPSHILAWTRIPDTGFGFFLFKDSGKESIEQIGKGVMTVNGHCTYLPGNEWILNDTYPSKDALLQSVYLYHVPTGKRVPLADFYAPPEYKGEWRCDTHPRSTIDGNYVIVDSPNQDGRQMYLLDIRDIVGKK